MISKLIDKGYEISDPWDAVTLFENKLALYAGSTYALCLDSCSNAIFLCLKYLNIKNEVIKIPKNTYASVPMQIIHSGNKIKFETLEWQGEYSIGDTPIIDAATRFRKGMYVENSYYCVSFHHRKTLKLGKGGVILHNDPLFNSWARPMIYDGRHREIPYTSDNLQCIGYHMYMTPEEAATGILLLEKLEDFNFDTGSSDTYKDLSLQEIFKPYYE